MTDSLAPGVVLRGKTGRTGGTPDIGWYVGYVERDRRAWFFAANIDLQSDADAPLRKQIALEALKLKGIIP
jgi:beta-lactamase class D